MTYESWHNNNFTRVHTADCPRRAVDSTADNAMYCIDEYPTIEQAVAAARAQNHRVAVCKECCPDYQRETALT